MDGQKVQSSVARVGRPVRRPLSLKIAPANPFPEYKENYEEMRNSTAKLQEYKRAISKLAALEGDAGIDVDACLASIDGGVLALIEDVAPLKRNQNIPENIKDYLCKYIELSVDRLKMNVRPIMRGLTPGLVDIYECEDARLAFEKTFCDLLEGQQNMPRQSYSNTPGVREDVSEIVSVAESSNDAVDEQPLLDEQQFISYKNVVRKGAASAMQVLVSIGIPSH